MGLGGFPAPAVVVLAGDCLTVARDSTRSVVIVAAVFPGLVAAARVGRRVARGRRGRRRGRRRRCRRARLPTPAVVVLTRDCLAVTSHPARPVVSDGAILARLIAAPRRSRRVASRRRRRADGRRCHGRRGVRESLDLCSARGVRARRDGPMLGQRTVPARSPETFVGADINPACRGA